MKPYIHFEEDDKGCYSQKLSEEVWGFQKSYILEDTLSPDGGVKNKIRHGSGKLKKYQGFWYSNLFVA